MAEKKKRKTVEDFLTFKEAREAVKEFGLTSSTQWRRFCQAGKRPENIPADPPSFYSKEWKGWRYFLSLPEKRFLPFTKARKLVHGIDEIRTSNDWWEYLQDHELPQGVPTRPDREYRDKGWKGWGDFVGTEKKMKLAS